MIEKEAGDIIWCCLLIWVLLISIAVIVPILIVNLNTQQSTLVETSSIFATTMVATTLPTTTTSVATTTTLVATTTTNTDMRGTDGANTVAPDNTSIAAILVDTGTTIPATLGTIPRAGGGSFRHTNDTTTEQVNVTITQI